MKRNTTQKSRLLMHLHNSFGALGLAFKIDDCKQCQFINVTFDKVKFSHLRPDYFDGMEVIYYTDQRIFEVLERMASPDEKEMWIYLETKSATVAIGEYMKGNQRKKDVIKIWD